MTHPEPPKDPNSAGVYDYLAGGRDNRPEERSAAQIVLEKAPYARLMAGYNREFLLRAVKELATAGHTQFLDIGAGLPLDTGNVHEVVQAINPGARVVYVDNDPRAHAHAKAILDGNGQVAFLEADARNPEAILAADETLRVIDFSKPVVVILVAVLHFVGDEADPAGIVRTLMEATAPGSVLVLTHVSHGTMPPDVLDAIGAMYREAETPLRIRTPEQIVDLFGDLPIDGGGLEDVQVWHNPTPQPLEPMRIFAGIAVKP